MPKAVLGAPRAFDLHQRLVGARNSQRRFVEAHVRPKPGDKVLDIGCGTGPLRALLPNELTYLGVEIDPAYVDVARARFGDEGEFVCSDIATFEPPSGHAFDLAIAYGVFHHLDDDT